MSAVGDSVLLVRAVDAGPTYVSYRWLDDPSNPTVHSIDRQLLTELGARLDAALVDPRAIGDPVHQVQRALLGPLSRADAEQDLSRAVTAAVLPGRLTAEIDRRARRGTVRIRVTPSPSLARVPFGLLVVGEDRRLLEVAEICYEPPAAIHSGRGRMPEPWTDEVAARPVLSVIDPKLPPGSGLSRILGPVARSANARLLADRVAAGPHTPSSGIGRIVGRWELSDDLRTHPGRLLYLGHVSSTLAIPGSASVHLSDDADTWGLARPLNEAHVPLSALDLLVGTSAPEYGPDGDGPPAPHRPGHELWPMPPRVALIACEGGADYRSLETFGLVMAIFSAGAEVVTTTQWALPSDEAFRRLAGVDAVPGPTTALALAVDDTHRAADPVAALAHWQRQRLHAWRADPGPANSPLTWASVTCHVCPPRAVQPTPGLA